MDDLFWAKAFGWPPDVVARQPVARMRRLAFVYGAASEGREVRAKAEADRARRTS